MGLATVSEGDSAKGGRLWHRRGERRILGPAVAELVQQFPEHWRTAAAWVLQAWEGAVRASSAVEHWHSILRVA